MNRHDFINAFATVVTLYPQEYKNTMHKVRMCEIHAEFLSGKVYGSWKMDLAASDYRLSHSQIDLLNEQRRAGLSILSLNRLAKMDPAIQEPFLSRVYSIRNIPEKDATDQEITSFVKDVRALLSDFSDLVDETTNEVGSDQNQN